MVLRVLVCLLLPFGACTVLFEEASLCTTDSECGGDQVCATGGKCARWDESCASYQRYVDDARCVDVCTGEPFEAPQILESSSWPTDVALWTGAISPDEKRLLLQPWYPGNETDLYLSTRANRSQSFASYQAVLMTQDVERPGQLDGDRMVLSVGPSDEELDVYAATLDENGVAGDRLRVDGLSSSTISDRAAWISPDLMRGYVLREGQLIEIANPTSDDFEELRTYSDQALFTFTLSRDELEIIYARWNADSDGLDLFSRRRASVDTEFGPEAPLDSLNTNMDELAPSLSGDGRTLYFNHQADALNGVGSRPAIARRRCD